MSYKGKIRSGQLVLLYFVPERNEGDGYYYEKE